MPRSIRIEYPGAFYHVMARGNRREEIFRDAGEAAGLDQDGIERLPGSDVRKVVIAQAIWESTTVSQSWIAERLRMSSAANVSQQLRRAGGGLAGSRLSPALRRWMKAVKI